MDKVRAMTMFVNIVEKGSLTAAAEALGTSPPSTVRALAALERSLGARLLNRTTRRIALTDEGRAYYERARRILGDIADVEAAVSQKQVVPQGRLAIGAPVVFGRLHVTPLVLEFLERHPGMRIELSLLDRMVNLVEDGLDASVRIGVLADSSLVAIEAGRTRRVVCASPAFLRRHGTARVPADLSRYPCIRSGGLAGGEWELYATGKPVRVRVEGPFTTNQIDTAIGACMNGLGYGLFLGYQVADLVRAGKLRHVLEGYEPAALPVSLVYPQARIVSARLRSFIDWFVPRLRAKLAGHKTGQGSGARGHARRLTHDA